jgi:hypothetical protein
MLIKKIKPAKSGKSGLELRHCDVYTVAWVELMRVNEGWNREGNLLE